jgi:hypothetical protein
MIHSNPAQIRVVGSTINSSDFVMFINLEAVCAWEDKFRKII